MCACFSYTIIYNAHRSSPDRDSFSFIRDVHVSMHSLMNACTSTGVYRYACTLCTVLLRQIHQTSRAALCGWGGVALKDSLTEGKARLARMPWPRDACPRVGWPYSGSTGAGKTCYLRMRRQTDRARSSLSPPPPDTQTHTHTHARARAAQAEAHRHTRWGGLLAFVWAVEDIGVSYCLGGVYMKHPSSGAVWKYCTMVVVVL